MTKPDRFDGKVNRTVDDSEPWWPPLPEHAHGPRPNVLLILFDDTGFAHFGCYGSTIDTPNIDALAARGLRYSNFHVTPLCSPSRAAILTGRNHHAVGMRTIANYHDGGFPNMRAAITPRAATLAEILQGQGYATYALGKWHLCPAEENSAAGPYDDWPLQRGFDRYYGFLSGATDQFYPELTCDNHHIDPPRTPEEGYHVTEDLVDHAIGDLRDKQSNRPQQPFFMYLSLGAMHEPHQAPHAYVEKYRGRFDAGWDEVRRQWFERQLASGIIPPDTELAPRNPGVDAWNDVPDKQQKFANRLQEAFAGFLDHSDAQIGRLLDYLETSDQLDNTIVILTSDNGTSGMGGPTGIMSSGSGGVRQPTSDGRMLLDATHGEGTLHVDDMDEVQSRLDDIGGPRSWCDIPWGWGQAGNTPLRWYKGDTYGGGVRVPLIVHWPERIREAGVRGQFHFATDITPTVLELLNLDAPTIYKGIDQMPLHGKSMAYSFDNPDAPSAKDVQYFEMSGHRGLWQDGWKVVTRHFRGSPYEEDEWDLYHLDSDFSECHNLADQQPQRLQAMIDRWWVEAGRYDVLPLDDRIIGMGGPSDRPGGPHDGLRYHYTPPVSHLHSGPAPAMALGNWEISADIERTASAVEGVLFAAGNMSGGISFYVQNNRLKLDYNARMTIFKGATGSALPAGRVTVGARFTSAGGTGRVALLIDGEDAGEVLIPSTGGAAGRGGADVGADRLSPVTDSYSAPFPFAGTIHTLDVVITPKARREPTPEEQSEAG